MNILIIGGGNMGFTYAKGILDAELPNTQVNILQPSSERRLFLQRYGFGVFEHHSDCVPNADVVLLAVKPQKCLTLFEQIKDEISPEQVVVSIMAGVSLVTIVKHLGVSKVARAMPNLPAQLGKGMTGVFFSEEVLERERTTICDILKTTGLVLSLTKESDIDRITGVSGSGTAYVFYFMNAMIKAAAQMEFSEKDAKEMVVQTFEGAVAQFNASDDDLTTWMNRVASKGGTTRAALDVLDAEKVEEHIKKCIFAACNRAVELGKEIQ